MRALSADEAQILADIADPVAAHFRHGGQSWEEHYRRLPILGRLTIQRRAERHHRGGWQITALGRLALRVAVATPAVPL